MTTIVILGFAVVLLGGLLLAEKKESLKGILLTKPLLSGLFIATALAQSHPAGPYFYLILTGLVLCFAGDICLAFFFNRRVFAAGLAFFLTGHLAYIAAFFIAAGVNAGTWVSVAAVSFISLYVFVRLRPHLGSMAGPVIAYVAIISLMVVGAASLAVRPDFSVQARALVMAGSILFYASDLFVARHRFVKKSISNRYAGLPMYYAAQFMLAFSVGLIP
ncbi:MAG TPA: lysoplasmalogenase [Syntrophus sp. (in: bacteria)]|nr:lysoplasmalogenase [Syntrophus sp. (in: bacteria)]